MQLTRFLIFASVALLTVGCIGNGSCERFNIDSFELTSGMNIPKVLDVECYSNDSLRISVFYIDTEASAFVKRYSNIDGYIERYKMEPIATATDLRLKGIDLLPEASITGGDLYVAEGRNQNGRYWKYVINKAENMLVSEMDDVR